MRKIILFYITLFFAIERVYAIPVLGITPFVLDLWVMFIVFSLGFINIIVFYIIKKIDLLYILLYIIFLGLNYYIIAIIKINNFLNMFN